ncbi:AAA family ATPase [Lachnoclostridium phytofermentans]|uniref:Putative abortive phage resistance n=1 Tax=Lachnoclostridium phytofermentans (strain ATCC 700394 / DSM 18823 / ISDg) TaxID=357809 RepID=A9KRN1_LACP7|nr:AAA family ATPase [Lachnoclostridium phytofermentans]ABX43525.1 putative abortive phage resistance [Lachnoclostridium phytofermentans ISDg]
MSKSIIRLQKINIQNLKNVALGNIRFSCNLWEDIYERKADVLGVYGQNGSGKTTLICALSLLKGLMSGTALPMNFSNMIKCGEQAAVCSFEFSVITEEQEKYKVLYEVTLTKEVNLTKEIASSQKENLSTLSEASKDNQVERSIVITNERFTISKLQSNRYEKSKTVKISEISDNVDVPNIKVSPNNFLADYLKEMKKEDIEELLSKSYKNSISYFFSKEILSVTESDNNEFHTIIHLLNYYAMYQLHIISNVQSGVINANIALPFSFVFEDKKSVSMLYGSLKLNGTSLLPKDLTPIIQQKIELVNVVLGELVPGLSIRLVELGEQKGENGEKLIETQLLARRGKNEILLQYESDGIKKLISILYTVILAYRDASVTVAIDELDSGIFEFLLGEILKIFEESGKGQLIFTSHNLRPLEVLNKKNILFTTTNEKHRYLRLQNVRANQNLRDFYFHDIILGGQKECIYEMTNPYVIRRAFKMAGDSDAK